MIYFRNDDIKQDITSGYSAPLDLCELRERAKREGYSLAYFNVDEHGAQILVNDDYLGLNELWEPYIGEGVFERFLNFEEGLWNADKKTQLEFKKIASEHYKELFTEVFDIFAIGALITQETDLFNFINPTKLDIYPTKWVQVDSD